MKIITLIDNIVYDPTLVAEHGFSLFIEINKKNILFDTGQSGHFIQNALKLGINLSAIDYCLISHGHYDHTGGLLDFIKYNKKAGIFLKEACFYEKYKSPEKYIGFPYDRNYFEKRLVFTNHLTEIVKDVYIFTNIQIEDERDTHFANMAIRKNNDFIPDNFADEQFLAVKNKDSLTIISGCSHRGISNIIKTAKDYFNLPVDLVLGGFHYKDESESNILASINNLNKLGIKNIGPSHCTGMKGFQIIRENSSSHVFYNYTGKVLENL